MRPWHAILLAVGILLLVSGGTLLLVDKYTYQHQYTITEWDFRGYPSTKVYEFQLAKGEVLKGSLVVESGTVVFVIGDKDNIVRDAGRVKAGESYTFSIKARRTFTTYKCVFVKEGSPLQATFYYSHLE